MFASTVVMLYIMIKVTKLQQRHQNRCLVTVMASQDCLATAHSHYNCLQHACTCSFTAGRIYNRPTSDIRLNRRKDTSVKGVSGANLQVEAPPLALRSLLLEFGRVLFSAALRVSGVGAPRSRGRGWPNGRRRGPLHGAHGSSLTRRWQPGGSLNLLLRHDHSKLSSPLKISSPEDAECSSPAPLGVNNEP